MNKKSGAGIIIGHPLLICFFIALILRLFYVALLPPDNLVLPVLDQQIYRSLSARLLSGEGLSCPPMDPVNIDVIPGEGHRRGLVSEAAQDGYFRGVVPLGQPTAFWLPLYPLFLALWSSLFGNSLVVLRISQALLSSVTVLLAWHLAGTLSRNGETLRFRVLSGLIFACYPFFLFFCGVLMTETLYMFLLMASILAYVHYDQEPTMGRACFLGILMGLTFLTRSVVAGLVPIAVVGIVLRQRFSSRSWSHVLLVTFSFLLVVSPWAIRNKVVFGTAILSPTKGGPTFWARNNPLFLEEELRDSRLFPRGVTPFHDNPLLHFPDFTNESEYVRSQELFRRMFRFIAEEPIVYAKLSLLKTWWFLSPFGRSGTPLFYVLISVLTYGISFLFALYGLVVERGRPMSWFVLWIIIFYFIVFHGLINGDTRFRIPVDQIIILCSLPAIDNVVQWMTKRIKPREVSSPISS